MKKTEAIALEVKQVSPALQAEQLISQAISQNVSVESLERLLTMRKELKQEFAKEAFDKAMAAFQSQCPTINKTKEVKNRSGVLIYKYAPIESILAQVKDPLRENGFSYSTSMELLPDGVKVCVKVTHEAGHSEETCMTVPLGNKTDIMSQSQVVAAATTFAKRYAFCNAFGILTGDEDTDALPQKEETIIKEKLDEKFITQINATKTYEDLVAVCKEIKTKIKPGLHEILVIEYTRRKDELSEEMANAANEAIK